MCRRLFEDGYEEDVLKEITCKWVYRTKNASFDLDTLESDTHLTGWAFMMEKDTQWK